MYVSIKDKQIEKGECVTTVQCLKRNIMEFQIPKTTMLCSKHNEEPEVV